MNRVTVSSSPVRITLHSGQKGERGIGISSVALNDQAHLIITYDDGKTQDAGAVLGDVTSIKDNIDSIYKQIQSSEQTVTKLEASTKANAEQSKQALQDTKSASTSGVATINDLVTTKMTYMTTTFDTLLTQAKANIDQWERDAEDKIHKVRTYSLEQIKTAHDDAMVDIERSVNKAEAWAVSETTPDREPDFESPTGLTQSARTWALYSKKKVQESVDTLVGIKDSEKNVTNMKDSVVDMLSQSQDSEQKAKSYMEQSGESQKKAKQSEEVVVNIAKEVVPKLEKLRNPVTQLSGKVSGALHVTYLDNTEKDITLGELGTYTTSEITDKISESLSSAKEYADTKVANLVDGAPEALDTLKELANTLGNDPNFSTTVLTKIGEKESKENAKAEYKAIRDEAAEKYVQQEPGKSLSDNNYTTAEQTKLAGIENGANKYVLPVASETTRGGIKVGTNLRIVDGVLSAVQGPVDLTPFETKTNAANTYVSKISLSNTLAEYAKKEAISPVYYSRSAKWAAAKTTITPPAYLSVAIGGVRYTAVNANPLDITNAENWDSNGVVVDRAGKDFYVYACVPKSGSVPKFILSANDTVPAGYATTNSRQVGGFHCECADVGTIEGHALSGYVAGDILPASMWDLLHRCKGSNEGMVYDDANNVWISIYLLSYADGKVVSRYNGVVLDGTSTPKTHGLWFTETLAKQNMRLPYCHEYFTVLKGCRERCNISNSKDAVTTGGHVYTNNVRCISNVGLEDPTGFMWQWSNNYGVAGGNGWLSGSYNENVDKENHGGTFGNLYLPLVGGAWDSGTQCGSRAVLGNHNASDVSANYGARGVSEPRTVFTL